MVSGGLEHLELRGDHPIGDEARDEWSGDHPIREEARAEVEWGPSSILASETAAASSGPTLLVDPTFFIFSYTAPPFGKIVRCSRLFVLLL